MATNFVQEGLCITLVAPAGGVVSGNGYVIGSCFVVATKTAAEGAEFTGCLMGVFALPKTGSQAWKQFAKVYWDLANNRCDLDPALGPFIGCAAAPVGSGAGETTGNVCLLGCAPTGDTFTIRKRFTVAQVNAGATILPALVGRKYRMIGAKGIAIGGAAGAVTTVDILATAAAAGRKLVALAQASLTQSTVLRDGATGAAVLADGASYTANDENTAVTIGKTGADVTTATHVDVILEYAIDPA